MLSITHTDMKKLFLILALMATTLSAIADSYHDMFVKYQTRTMADYETTLRHTTDSVLAQSKGGKDSIVIRIISEYVLEQMVVDITDVLEPYYRQHLSEQDMAAIMTWEAAHPEHAAITPKIVSAIKQPAGEKMIRSLAANVSQIAEGKTLNHPKLDKGVSRKYYKACTSVLWSNNKDLKPALQDATNQILDLLVSLAPDKINATQKAGIQLRLNQFIDYAVKDLPVLYTNMLYEAGITKEEAMLIQERATMPAARNERKVALNLVRNIIPVGSDMIGHVMSWGMTHYPDIFTPLQAVVDKFLK